MNLEELRNKSILLFGKPRAFNEEEFFAELDFYKINILQEMSDAVVLIVDGRMMTPYEQNNSEELYGLYKDKIEFISIDILEQELAKHIDPNTLLMSLKLSHDKDRLKSFIQNTCLSDEVFLKLLNMYNWNGENFFENNDNRDVSAATILRFYENIERNHNIQYATSGFIHLVVQAKNENLIKEIFSLEPLKKSFNKDSQDSNYNILTAIATHPQTPKLILKELIEKSNTYMRVLISIRQDCDDDILKLLYETDDEEVHEALAYNTYISKEISKKLLSSDKNLNILAQYSKLDEELFQIFANKSPAKLAKNESLNLSMQERLVGLHKKDVMVALAANTEIKRKVLLGLLDKDVVGLKSALYENPSTPDTELEDAYKNVSNHIYLAFNKNTPKHILELMAKSKDIKVLLGIAKNENTPVEVLYQLQLDARLARAVKENSVFGQHIQTENLGWL